MKISTDKDTIRSKIKRFIIHPGFNSKTVDNDIALVELTTPLESFSEKVQPICIPTNSETDYYAGKIGTVSGWGKTEASVAGSPSKGSTKTCVLTN
jgi:secreted trypsin-like serine protease